MAGRGAAGSRYFPRLFAAALSTSAPSSSSVSGGGGGVEVRGFLKAVGKGVEAHAEKAAQQAGDSPDFLRLRRGWFKKLGIPCKQRKLILRYTEKYRQGLWRPQKIPDEKA